MVDDEDAAHVTDDVPPPDVPGFELGLLLARGGTSEVWAGVAVDGGRRVAVKVVSAGLGAVEAAAREAAVSARAASAHVVGIEACVPLADGRVALVMPHLRGGALDALVRARGHLSPGELVTVLAPVASALGRLHDLGVVHGDVSPGNVLLDLDGRPVLGDLGLGQVVGDASPGVWGTDGYVAPEVVLGADPTPAADVYGIGALGWLCLSGAVPGPPGLRPRLADLSRAGADGDVLVQLLDAAVSPDPGERPSAHELAWQLFAAVEAEPLDLVRGDDEVTAVTYRLRAAAGAPATPPRVSRRRLRRGDGRRTLRGRPQPPGGPVRVRGPVATPRRRGRHARVADPSGTGRSGPAGMALLSGVCSLVLLTVLVLAVAALGRGGGVADAHPTTRPASGVVSDSGAEGAFPAVPGGVTDPREDPTDPREDPAAPRERPEELVAVLADARAAAWREATPALLHAAVAPGSPAADRDSAAVTAMVRSGVRYAGLRYTVAEVVAVAVSDDEAAIRASIGTSAYAVVGPSGSTPRSATAGEPVLVDVVRTAAGWRVHDVRTPS